VSGKDRPEGGLQRGEGVVKSGRMLPKRGDLGAGEKSKRNNREL